VSALEALKRADPVKLVDAIGYASRGAELARKAGRRREAIALLRLVLHGYEIYASWASSGSEGLGRMVDVDRVRDRLAGWEREA
jgi:hypothetical protein